ncbi:MAG: hypothetical protein IRZ07_29195 [Microbispora sp.]|nr:hypothetical protein [Microbispora sp.]
MFKTTTPLQRLRESSYALAELPDSIRTGDIGEFGQPIAKALSAATVDDVAFAIQALGDEADAIYRRVTALKQLHDRARRAGARGADLAVEAAVRFEERRK